MKTKRPDAQRERLSVTAENYLSSIYKLEEWGVTPAAAQLAEYIRHLPKEEGLGTTLPSVLGMLRRLVREGLVEISAQKQIHLTPTGRALAETTIRRHRLAERMVVDLLGMELHLACIEGHRLEHAISPALEEHIRERLGNPMTCPYGSPIPGSDYKPPPNGTLSLGEARPQRTYVVDRIADENPILLRYLVDRGVLPGEELTVVDAGYYRGVLSFQTEKGEGSIGYEAAPKVRLRRPPQAKTA
jgi:DtxR family Mn-dependent transcriptional regulator